MASKSKPEGGGKDQCYEAEAEAISLVSKPRLRPKFHYLGQVMSKALASRPYQAKMVALRPRLELRSRPQAMLRGRGQKCSLQAEAEAEATILVSRQ